MASIFHNVLVLLNQRGYDGRMERLEMCKVFWSENMEGKEHFLKFVRIRECINKTLCIEVD
jgi:plasmid rolling circle replication initiator protein Rep